MKTVEEMTHEDLIELTHGDVEHMTRLQCAERGIKLLVEPVAPVKPTYDRTVRVYKVAGVETLDHDFALALAQLIGANLSKAIKTDYDYHHGSDARHVKQLSDYEKTALTNVEANVVMSEEIYRTVAPALYEYKNALATYEKEKKEFDSANREYRNIEEAIWEVVNAAAAKQRDLEKSEQRFKEYMELAQQNRDMAKKFFLKAWTPGAWVLQKLFPEDYQDAACGNPA